MNSDSNHQETNSREERKKVSPDQVLQSLFDRYWEFRLFENPLMATSFGAHHHDDRLPDHSPGGYKRRKDREHEFLEELRDIDRGSASESYRKNADILERILMRSLREKEFGGHYLKFNKIFGFHNQLAQIHLKSPFRNEEDFEHYLKRLQQVKAYILGHRQLLEEGVEQDRVPPRIAVEDVGGQIKKLLVSDPAKSPFYAPFEDMPGHIPGERKEKLKQRARDLITEVVEPSFRSFLSFLEESYMPALRDSISLSEMEEGEPYYDHLVRKHTTPRHTAEQIHKIGREEVERVRTRMEEVMARDGFEGTLAEYEQRLRTDEANYFETPEDLVREYRNICKRMDAELPALIGTLPRTPYGVRELPESGAEEAPPAFYHRASGEGGRPGWLLVNTSHLSSRPRYEMVALALHETVPGHHVQIALQNEQKQMADFRRIAEFPAFIEGWALYAEKLGEEVGMYQREQDRFGRLSFEMLRAARLVVDTGIHDRGWSRSRACQYLLEKTALTEQNVNAEVDRYISVPGQALSYKMGERVLLRLREKAEHELESTFSRRAFHDQILEEGAMPLDMLEDKVNRWIKSRKPS